jgi:hypothetical protein
MHCNDRLQRISALGNPVLFSLLSFFPVLRLDQVFLVVEGTRGRAVAERPSVFITFGSSSPDTNGESDLWLSRTVTGAGDKMFGWSETCWRAGVDVCAGDCAGTKVRVISKVVG